MKATCRVSLCLLATAVAAAAVAQGPATPPRIEIGNPNATFPAQQRALPPAEVVERGNGLYQVNCMGCHGRDLRGGDQGGPNLLRSEVVLNDVEGELIGQIVRGGQNRMPAITTLDADGVRAVAGYIHSVVATAQGQGAPPRVDYDLDIVVGNVRRGERAFGRYCSNCHSAGGDLAGIASAIDDPVNLQNSWVAGRRQGRIGGGAPMPKTITVTQPDGTTVSGALVRYDDFFASLRTSDGAYRSFSRHDGAPSVEVVDPLQGHVDLWSKLDDDTIHDVTAFLETLK